MKTERSYEDRACEVSQRSGEHRQTQRAGAGTERNATLKTVGFKVEWSVGERAKRLQTKHKVLLDSVKDYTPNS